MGFESCEVEGGGWGNPFIKSCVVVVVVVEVVVVVVVVEVVVVVKTDRKQIKTEFNLIWHLT